MKDFLGQEIAVGDWVAYPTSSGHSPIMNHGQVKSLVREDFTQKSVRYGDRKIEHWVIGIWSHGNSWYAKHETKRTSYPNWKNVIKIQPPELHDDRVPE